MGVRAGRGCGHGLASEGPSRGEKRENKTRNELKCQLPFSFAFRFFVGLVFCGFFFSAGAASDPLFSVDPTWSSRYSEGNRAGEGGSLPKAAAPCRSARGMPGLGPAGCGPGGEHPPGALGTERAERGCRSGSSAPREPHPPPLGHGLKIFPSQEPEKLQFLALKVCIVAGKTVIAAARESTTCAAGESARYQMQTTFFFYFCFVPILVYHISFGFTPDLL